MITQEELKEVCKYDPATGFLIWKQPGRKRIVGKVLGSIAKTGYLETCINRKRYLVHRLVWFWHTGVFPSEHTDHINHNRLDNRIENLRAVTNQQNNFNQSKRNKPTSSKWRGVSWNKERKAWITKTKWNGRHIYIGQFQEEADAAQAFNFFAYENWGVFANLNKAEGSTQW